MSDPLSKSRRFTFDDGFNSDVEGVEWPREFKELKFGRAFDRPLARVIWRTRLEEIGFVDFKRPLLGVSWPKTLHTLCFFDIDQRLAGVPLPSL